MTTTQVFFGLAAVIGLECLIFGLVFRAKVNCMLRALQRLHTFLARAGGSAEP